MRCHLGYFRQCRASSSIYPEARVKKSEIKLSKEADKAYKEVERMISKSDIKNNFEKLTKTQRVRGTKESKAA